MAAQDEVARSRVTLRYKTEVNGEEAPEELPFRQLVIGDFSGGTSKDRKEDLENRRIRSFDGNNTSEMINDMDIHVDMVVPNRVDAGKKDLRVNLKIEGKQSFDPNEIAKQVPHLRGLLQAKQLLLELQSNIANKKELGALLNKLYANEEIFNQVKQGDLKDFSKFQIAFDSDEESEQGSEQEESEEGNA